MSAANTPPTWHTTTTTALGELTLVRDDDGLRGVYYPHHWYRPDPATFGPRRDDGFDDTVDQLAAYLAGARREFALPLSPHGDAFRLRVWKHVAQIGYARTSTYGELAARVGGGATAQEIGAAVGRNPLSVVIPCHRVVGKGGTLTGYAGGLRRKRWLLDLEADHAGPDTGAPVQSGLLSVQA